MDVTSQSLFLEKMSIEPDLGDQRKSIFKALPAPPNTPKRVMMKYRFSAVFPFVIAVASFVLTIAVVLARKENGTFEEQYLIAVSMECKCLRVNTANNTLVEYLKDWSGHSTVRAGYWDISLPICDGCVGKEPVRSTELFLCG